MEIINKYYKNCIGIYAKAHTFEQYKEKLKFLQDGKEELTENLKTKTVIQLRNLLNKLGAFTDSRDKKAYLIEKVYSNLENYFLLGRGVSYSPMSETYDQAKERQLNAVTAETLQAFNDKREAQSKEQEKAIKNPENLKEFRIFIELQGFKSLSPEQVELYEKLKADTTLKVQEREAERKSEILKVDIKNADFYLHPTKHSKTGEDIFTVVMTDRVDPETFKELRIKAKQFDGYYSRFKNKNAEPPIKAGFNFDTQENAVLFMGLKEENQSNQETTEQKKEVVKLSAVDRLRASATAKIEKAEESLNQERTTNTHRQIRQAGASEDKARREISFGKKMLNIADGLENGSIKYLHALRNGKQLEQLDNILSRAFYRRMQEEGKSSQSECKNIDLDINFVRYPFPVWSNNVIKTIFWQHEDTKGMKQDVKKILKHCARFKDDESIYLKEQYLIDLFKRTALKLSSTLYASNKSRILDEIKDYERIYKMGLTDLPILKTALRELRDLGKNTGLSQEEKDAIKMQELERSFVTKKIAGFFPTPAKIIDKMFSIARVFEGETVREPQAGMGHIAEKIQLLYPANELKVNEVNFSLCELLTKKGFNLSEHRDFLQETEKTDVIFMNPPFEKNQDIDHVKHAFSLLNEGGRLVAIMAGNKKNSGVKKVQEFKSFVEDFGYMEDNEAGSFKSAFISTGVSTCIVYLEKPTTSDETEPQEEEKETAKPLKNEDGSFNIEGHLTVINSGGQDVTHIYKGEPQAPEIVEASGQMALF